MDYKTLINVLVKVSRPVGWPFGPILFAIGFLHSPKLVAHKKVAIISQFISLSFPLALVVFGVNDVYDHATDFRNPRKIVDSLEGTILDPAHHNLVLSSAWLASAVILGSSLLLARLHNTFLTLVLLVLSWQYSAPPLRFKERPILDSLSNGAIIDLSYLVGYTAGGGYFDSKVFELKGHILGLCTAGVHALAAVVDLDADAAVGQRTIATMFGPRVPLVFGAFTYFVAFLIERDFTVFGLYILGGFLVMLSPLFDLSLAHLAFQTIVYWTGAMSAVWFAQKALRAYRWRHHFKSQ